MCNMMTISRMPADLCPASREGRLHTCLADSFCQHLQPETMISARAVALFKSPFTSYFLQNSTPIGQSPSMLCSSVT